MGTVRRFRNAIGPQLRKLRTERNLTQDALAARLQRAGLDLDRTALAKMETQIRSVFDFELAMIARVLRVSAEKLLPTASALDANLPALMDGLKTLPKQRAQP